MSMGKIYFLGHRELHSLFKKKKKPNLVRDTEAEVSLMLSK